MKIQYEMVSIEADKILSKILDCSDIEAQDHYDTYLVYLEACGWTEEEYSKEMSKRIDIDWT